MVFDYKILSADDDTVTCQVYDPETKMGYELRFNKDSSVKDVFLMSMKSVNQLIEKKEELNKKFDEVMDNGS